MFLSRTLSLVTWVLFYKRVQDDPPGSAQILKSFKPSSNLHYLDMAEILATAAGAAGTKI